MLGINLLQIVCAVIAVYFAAKAAMGVGRVLLEQLIGIRVVRAFVREDIESERFARATLVIIAQCVSSIVDADQILVLDGGMIVGRGAHSELLETSETYREIVSSQLAAEETV